MLTSTRKIHRLNHVPFQYRITVNNKEPTPKKQWLTVRIFLAPQQFINDRRKWIEMDKFRYKADMAVPSFVISMSSSSPPSLQKILIFVTALERSSFQSSILQHKQNEEWKYGMDDGSHADDRDPYPCEAL